MENNQTVSVAIREAYIRLDSFLKLAGAVDTGGRAKIVIQGGHVLVNGVRCDMRGKKIRHGDQVAFGGVAYVCQQTSV